MAEEVVSAHVQSEGSLDWRALCEATTRDLADTRRALQGIQAIADRGMALGMFASGADRHQALQEIHDVATRALQA
jgi:hypothetical protein